VARQDSRHRVLRLALCAQCTAQFAGIVIATEIARRRAERSGRGSLGGKLILAPDWDSDAVNESIAADFGTTP
jgi:hypothetical protein